MAGKKCWWNTDLTDDIEIITSNYPPLDQSSPKADRFEELDHITDDLEDSIMRLDTKKLPKYHMDEFNLEKAFELPEPSPSIVESTLDERGRKVTVTEDVSSAFSGSRSRSRTPFKIRDNISHLLGWDKLEDQDPEYDETISKLGISGSLQKDKIHFSKLSYRKPCSRLALLDNDQVSAFNFELRLIRNHITDFPLNFPWVVWVSKESKTEWKTIIGNKIDFKSATKFIKSIYTDCKIMVFKLGVLPKRKNAENIDSISIDIQVSHDNDYDAFKQILYTCLDGNLYSPDIDRTYKPRPFMLFRCLFILY